MATPRLILDSGGVSAVVEGEERALAWFAVSTRRGYLIGIPAPVIAEVMTRQPRDSLVFRALSPRENTLPTTFEIAHDAGTIRHRARRPQNTIDALVVATATQHPGSIILTSDPRDIQRLVDERPNSRLTVRSVNEPTPKARRR